MPSGCLAAPAPRKHASPAHLHDIPALRHSVVWLGWPIYQELDGTAAGELDPKDPLNAIITDLELTPRVHGKVQYSFTFSILIPVNLSKSNHTLLYDIVNRGNKVITGWNNVIANPPAYGDGNVAPTDPLPVVRYDAKDHQCSLDVMRWGLVPFWAKDIKVGFANINAKAEGIENKPAFREAKHPIGLRSSGTIP